MLGVVCARVATPKSTFSLAPGSSATKCDV